MMMMMGGLCSEMQRTPVLGRNLCLCENGEQMKKRTNIVLRKYHSISVALNFYILSKKN